MEACKVDGTPYGGGEEVPGFWKCAEWTNRKAIPALWGNGLIKMVNGGEVIGNDTV